MRVCGVADIAQKYQKLESFVIFRIAHSKHDCQRRYDGQNVWHIFSICAQGRLGLVRKYLDNQFVNIFTSVEKFIKIDSALASGTFRLFHFQSKRCSRNTRTESVGLCELVWANIV